MMNFNNDEMNLMAIYNTGARKGLIEELTSMREYLEEDEANAENVARIKNYLAVNGAK